MKNKVKFFGIVMLILITLFCSVVIACSDDDDDDGGSQSTNPNDPGGPGGPGGPGDPGDPGTPTLSGNVIISPASAVIGTLLTASYSGTESVSYQWRIGGQDKAGATGTQYIADEVGTYQVIVSAAGYASKASNTVTVSSTLPPTTQPAGALVAYITGTQETPFNLGNRTFNEDMFVQGFTSKFADQSNTIPFARFFQISNGTAAAIQNITLTFMRGSNSSFNVSDEPIDVDHIINGTGNGAKGDTWDSVNNCNVLIPNLPAGQNMWIAVQPAYNIPAGYHYDILRIEYPGIDPSKVIEIHFQFLLQKAPGLDLPPVLQAGGLPAVAPVVDILPGPSIPATWGGVHYIQVTTSGAHYADDAILVPHEPNAAPKANSGYYPEYAIKEADLSNAQVPPAVPPADTAVWIRNREILTFTRNAAGDITGTTVTPAATSGLTTDVVQFRGLKPNTPYWIYSRFGDGTNSNYLTGPILYSNPGATGAPRVVSTLPAP